VWKVDETVERIGKEEGKVAGVFASAERQNGQKLQKRK
jgi:hypothetical protein